MEDKISLQNAEDSTDKARQIKSPVAHRVLIKKLDAVRLNNRPVTDKVFREKYGEEDRRAPYPFGETKNNSIWTALRDFFKAK